MQRRKCRLCNEWFTPRRSTKKFCSDACRKLAFERTTKGRARKNKANGKRPTQPPKVRERKRWTEFDSAHLYTFRGPDGKLHNYQLVGQVWRPRWHYCYGMMMTPNFFGGHFVQVD